MLDWLGTLKTWPTTTRGPGQLLHVASALAHPTDSSKPSAVKVGSLAVGRYTAALATRASRRRPLHRGRVAGLGWKKAGCEPSHGRLIEVAGPRVRLDRPVCRGQKTAAAVARTVRTCS